MPLRRWFDREFELGLPPEAFPDIVERIRGVPARVEERVRDVASDRLVQRVGDTWSIQENVAHLTDLEPLWEGRLDDLLAGTTDLRPADLQNRKTHEARHNEREMPRVLSDFRRAREGIVRRLDALDPAALNNTALHPRLKKPMTIVDLFFFVAEHDDHHMVRITEMLRATG